MKYLAPKYQHFARDTSKLYSKVDLGEWSAQNAFLSSKKATSPSPNSIRSIYPFSLNKSRIGRKINCDYWTALQNCHLWDLSKSSESWWHNWNRMNLFPNTIVIFSHIIFMILPLNYFISSLFNNLRYKNKTLICIFTSAHLPTITLKFRSTLNRFLIHWN